MGGAVCFAYACPRCPGDGVVRAERPGVDWPEPCLCEARTAFSQYQLGRVLDEEPKTIVRVAELRAGPDVCARILHKLAQKFYLGGSTQNQREGFISRHAVSAWTDLQRCLCEDVVEQS